MMIHVSFGATYDLICQI